MILFSNSGPFFATKLAVLSTIVRMSGGGCMIPIVLVCVAIDAGVKLELELLFRSFSGSCICWSCTWDGGSGPRLPSVGGAGRGNIGNEPNISPQYIKI
ncbi:hypothetical protein LXL04_007751 [Taraxacum kok-saghyz]